MPDKETILRRLAELPIKPLMEITDEDKYFWEGDEERAHFKVTKDVFPPPMQLVTLSLSVSGEPSGRAKIKSDFRQALGEELESETLQFPQPIEFVLWDASSIRQNLS